MDELRDYRFYADDLLHPSAMAVEVVWSRFKDAWIGEQALPVMKKIERIRKGLEHRPFDAEGEGHLQFMERLNNDIRVLKANFPYMEF